MDLKKAYNKGLFFYLKNRKIIDIGLQSINVVQQISKKHYINTVREINNISNSLSRDYYYATDLLSAANGWETVFPPTESSISTLFDLNKYPCRKVKMQGVLTFYSLTDKIEIATHKAQYHFEQINNIFFNRNFTTREEVIEILSQDLFNSLQTKCAILDNTDNGPYREEKYNALCLHAYELPNYDSMVAKDLSAYLTKSIDLKIPRSIMLYSEPGTGKSCIAAASLRHLDLRTMKINNFNGINNAVILLIIKMLKIEAVLIDDLDHMHIDNNSAVLDFLEKVRKQVKVVIATVNSTKPFHKAVLRPGRFDKIIAVHSLDEAVIKKVLGENLLPYFDKVKEWPIAFINELCLSSQLEDISIDDLIAKLQKRVGVNNVDTVDLDGKHTLPGVVPGALVPKSAEETLKDNETLNKLKEIAASLNIRI